MTAAHPAEPAAMLLSDTSWRICLFNRRQLSRSEADISHLQRKRKLLSVLADSRKRCINFPSV